MIKNKKTNVINLGCRLNLYEGEVIKSLIKKYNIDDYTIINSCAVTNEAEKKVDYIIRKSKKKYPLNKIILTGCAAQINPEKYKLMSDVDIIIGNHEKTNEQVWKNFNKIKRIQVRDILNIKTTNNHIINKFEGKTRAYIEIQQGCDHRCTFCIIPFGRGNNRSVPVEVIINRVKKIVKNNYKEVVLTGVDITDYGKNLPGKPNLFQLCEQILNSVPDLKQLRLSSIDCAEINDDFWMLLNDNRIMPHFHLSLQSGNDLILKRMKRRHTKLQAIEFLNKVRSYRNDVVFGADFIVGFPTETDKMFEETVNFVKHHHLIHLHVFPFSPRNSTPASKMPQIPKNIIKKRAEILRECGNNNLIKFLESQIGLKTKVLIEQVRENKSLGKSQHFTKIEIPEKLEKGSIVDCTIKNVSGNISKAILI